MMCIGKHAAAVEAALTRAPTGDSGEAQTVQMPVEYLEWVLAQKKEHYRVPTLEDYAPEDVEEDMETICRVNAALQAAYDEFDEFKAWVGDIVQTNGCISVPGVQGVLRGGGSGSFQGLLQDKIDCEWEEARQEFYTDMELFWTGDVAPLGPHLYLLSVYLSLIYRQFRAHDGHRTSSFQSLQWRQDGAPCIPRLSRKRPPPWDLFQHLQHRVPPSATRSAAGRGPGGPPSPTPRRN